MTDAEIVDFLIAELNVSAWSDANKRRPTLSREDVELNHRTALTIVRGSVDRTTLAEAIGELFAKRMKAKLVK